MVIKNKPIYVHMYIVLNLLVFMKHDTLCTF